MDIGNESPPQDNNTWSPHMFTSLISNSAILKSREGRAGKVYNFMRGLRLSTLLLNSPCGDLTKEALAAQEADAVKGLTPVQSVFLTIDSAVNNIDELAVFKLSTSGSRASCETFWL